MDSAYLKIITGAERRRLLLRCAALFCAVPLGVAARAAGTTTRRIPLPGFSRVRVDLPATVLLQPGTPAQALVTAEPGLIDRISVTVSQDELRIAAAESFRTQEKLEVTVHFANLSRVELRSAGDLEIRSLKTPEFVLIASGSGNARLRDIEVALLRVEAAGSASIVTSGHAGEQQLSLGGSFTYQGEALRTERTRARLAGSGDATVWATQTLEATVDGAGSLRYRGSPAVRQQIAGAGSIDQLE